MRMKMPDSVKRYIGSSGNRILYGLVVIALYEYVISPSKQFLPMVPVFLYNFLATAMVLIFLAGLAIGIWLLLKEGWRHITIKEVRKNTIEKICDWPNSKWDILWSLAVAYLLLLLALMLIVTQVIPRERLVGVVSPEEARNIAVYLIVPLLLVVLPLFVRGMANMFRDMKQRLVSGGLREKVTLSVSTSFALIAYGAVVIGDFAGWGHLLWFNAA